MKRNIIRYVMPSYCMVLRTVSFVVKKRFPDLEHLVDAGLLREDELKVGFINTLLNFTNFVCVCVP